MARCRKKYPTPRTKSFKLGEITFLASDRHRQAEIEVFRHRERLKGARRSSHTGLLRRPRAPRNDEPLLAFSDQVSG